MTADALARAYAPDGRARLLALAALAGVGGLVFARWLRGRSDEARASMAAQAAPAAAPPPAASATTVTVTSAPTPAPSPAPFATSVLRRVVPWA